MTRILLKARPTPSQLADRLGPPTPAGMELYLDRRDLADARDLGKLGERILRRPVPPGFVWIVEAPTRTIDGHYFDLTANTDDGRETLRRVVEVGRAIGAVAANVHLVAPTPDATRLSPRARREAIEATRPMLDFYVTLCRSHGMIPQVENIPPVGRMREAAFVFSPIGVAPSDLATVGEWYPLLRFTVDTSHAALYQSWRRVPLGDVDPALRAVARFCRLGDESHDLGGYLARTADRALTVHVSNAAGLLGEGLGYAAGSEDLDRALLPLVGVVPYFVTETLEADDDHAEGMRDAQAALARLCLTRSGGSS